MVGCESKLYKMGFNEYQSSAINGIYDVNIDMTNVINVGGGGVILTLTNVKVLKVEKINIVDAKKWDKNREKRKLDGTSPRIHGATELYFGEELLLNGFEFASTKKIINRLDATGKSNLIPMILDSLKCHLLEINSDEWFITTGKLNKL